MQDLPTFDQLYYLVCKQILYKYFKRTEEYKLTKSPKCMNKSYISHINVKKKNNMLQIRKKKKEVMADQTRFLRPLGLHSHFLLIGFTAISCCTRI